METHFEDHLITNKASIIDALRKINSLPVDGLTLFAVDDDMRVVGAMTDGDVRRAIIRGADISSPIEKFIKKDFKYLTAKEIADIPKIKEIRALGIVLLPVLDAEGRMRGLYNLNHVKSLLPVDAVLMAGGKGERLRPLTEKTPKPLLPVGNKSIIDHNIDRLISYGIEHISVTTNYLKEQIEEHFRDDRRGVKIDCVSEPCYLGTIGSVKFVKHFYNDTILVMNSDLFTNINYEDFYLHFMENDADMSVAAVPYRIAVPYGIMDIDGIRVKGMIEKPTYNFYANGGIYLIKREMLDLIPDGEFFNATDLISKLIKTNHRVIRFPINGTWIDIGNPQEYQKACDLAEHIQ